LEGYTVYKGFPLESEKPRDYPKRPDWRVLFSSSLKNGERLGAVGIENNNGRDSMDLRGTRRSATSLKRNGKERKGMPIAPLMLPSFFSSTAFPSLRVFIAASNGKVGFGQNFCGTDGKPVPHST
jgi:hypothetical protein